MNKPSSFCPTFCPRPPRSAPPLLQWVRREKEKCKMRWAEGTFEKLLFFSKMDWRSLKKTRRKTRKHLQAFALHLGIFSISSSPVFSLPQFLQPSSSPPPPPHISQSLNKEEEEEEEEDCSEPSLCFRPSISYSSAMRGGEGDQTSWSKRSWKVSRPRQEFLRAPSEPSWAAKRNSLLSSVTEPRDKASCSSDTLTALGLSCEQCETS